jgi:hypothetical protein
LTLNNEVLLIALCPSMTDNVSQTTDLCIIMEVQLVASHEATVCFQGGS